MSPGDPRPIVDVAIAVIRRGGRCFLQRRDPADAILPGLWEFPGGKVKAAETPEGALRRELMEEIAWTPSRVAALPIIDHTYPERSVRLHPFLCEGPDQPRTELAWGWFLPREIDRLPVPEANAALIASLQELAR
ncbi:MAG TPA: (deoxy)nucleoside triphosphate pyrophosphohydrolase [Holophagaceae bacterium]|nr:(deoxy)nucleoside triphosphate pyrophosphohydrolase [Holophagaceae bacterium]